MQIFFDNNGGAYYYFYLDRNTNRIRNADLYKALRYSIIAACAVSAAIIVATLAEDIVSYGVGIWNDAVSFLAAASSMFPILQNGLRLAGLTA